MNLKDLRAQLNAREAAFCHQVADGGNQTQSYQAAYPGKRSDASAAVAANRLLKKDKIKAYLEALQTAETEALVYSRQKKRERLYQIGEALQPGVSPGEQIQAIKVDNDMTGDNKPVRVEGEITLKGILDALKPTTGLPNE